MIKIPITNNQDKMKLFNLFQKKEKQGLKKAKADGAQLVVFSELAVSGYPPYDFLERKEFIEKCTAAIQTIAKEYMDMESKGNAYYDIW